jgi:cyanophycin synthetase
VILRNNANLSTGGTATDVTDDVHPSWPPRRRGGPDIGLDICGIDVVCETMLKPLEEQSGGIVEVNAAPGLRMHLSRPSARAAPVGEGHRRQHDVPPRREWPHPGRGHRRHQRQDHHQCASSPHLLEQDGNARRHDQHRRHLHRRPPHRYRRLLRPASARNVLLHPDVDAAVFETARGGVLREGLGFDRCDVAVVTNIGIGDHLGLNYITTVDDLAVVKRVIVENVAAQGTAVLNAADPVVVDGRQHCPGRCIFFAADRMNPCSPPTAHRATGSFCRAATPSSAARAQEAPRAAGQHPAHPQRHHRLPGRERHGLHRRRLGAGHADGSHRTRSGHLRQRRATAPGRFNVFDYKGATLIADYGHNPDAIQALVAGRRDMPARRRSVVISGAGDRRDEDIRQQTEILGDAFDDVILYQDACQRGRADGEVIALLRDGLAMPRRTRQIEPSPANSSPSTPPWPACSPATCA